MNPPTIHVHLRLHFNVMHEFREDIKAQLRTLLCDSVEFQHGGGTRWVNILFICTTKKYYWGSGGKAKDLVKKSILYFILSYAMCLLYPEVNV